MMRLQDEDARATSRERTGTHRLADLAFGANADARMHGHTLSRHLAMLDAELLALDLSDPAQRVFGEYEFLEHLGEGGMGVVYRARQASLEREVAIKLLAAGPWAQQAFIERFRREAQNAARMQHPNIVPIFEVGCVDELHYFAMQLVRGGSLAGLLKREGRLDANRAARLVRTIAEAVDYAHRLGVLHLDLKPGNVLLDEDGIPHVADFGLARRIDTGAIEPLEISGTPSYMAPEQGDPGSAKIGPASDIWGLGAILYELVTGAVPFSATSSEATLHLVRTATPRSPRRYVEDLPRDIEAIALKCLARDPAQRYASARDLADDLTRFLEGRAVHARPLDVPQRLARWARREPKLAATALAAIATLLIGTIATTSQWRRAESSATQRQIALWDQRRAEAARLFERNDAFSALPSLLANLAEQERSGASVEAAAERARLGAIFADSPRLIDAIATGERSISVALSPDASRVAVGNNDSIHLYATDSGRLLWRTPLGQVGQSDSGVRLLEFSADGRRLVGQPWWPPQVTRPSGWNTLLLDAADGRVLAPAQPPAEMTHAADGAFAIAIDDDLQAQLLRTADWSAVGPRFAHPPQPAARLLAPGAKFYAIAADSFRELRLIDPSSGKLRLTRRFEHGIAAWAASSGGRWLALAEDDGHVSLLDIETLQLKALDHGPDDRVYVLNFASDDSWLGAASIDGSATVWNIPSGELAMAPVHEDDIVVGVMLDRPAKLLAAAEKGTHCVRLWRLPDGTDAEAHPLPLPAQICHDSAVLRYAMAWAPQHGLFASASSNGQLRLWRLPPDPRRHARAAPQQPAELRFDGKHLVAIAGRRVQVLDAASEQALGAAIELPQPAGFAELADDTLVTTQGRALDAWNWRDGRRRFATLELPATPMKFALSVDGQSAAASWSELRDGRLGETVASIDLANGRVLAQRHLEGTRLSGLRFGLRGSELVAWSLERVHVLDPATLVDLRDAVTPPATAPIVLDAQLDERRGQLATSSAPLHNFGERREEAGMLCLQSFAQDAAAPDCRPTAATSLIALGESGRRVAGSNNLFEAGRASSLELPVNRNTKTVYSPPVALSADEKLLAVGGRNGVLLLDPRDGRTLLPELAAPLERSDALAQLAFSPDASALLARSQQGRWLYWALPVETRPLDQIRRYTALLTIDPKPNLGMRALDALPDAQRAELRESAPPLVRAAQPLEPLPPLPPTPGTALLDLSRHYTAPLDGLGANHFYDLSALGSLPQGQVRMLGIDYDIRGVVALCPLQGYCPYSTAATATAARDIAVGEPHAPALHALLLPALSCATGSTIATVTLHYRSGDDARVPLRCERDVAQNSAMGPEPVQAQIAWMTNPFQGRYWGTDGLRISHVRIENPYPQREWLSIDLDPDTASASVPVFLALSQEPALPSTAHSDAMR